MVAMPEPGSMASLSQTFVPAHLVGMTIDTKDALKFDFIIHKGDLPLTEEQKPEEYRQLVKYFLAALAIPDEDQWVNLSPYEGSRIIKDNFGMTEMGRDLLTQDYLLKQLTASLMHPDSELGKRFWERIYTEAHAKFGTTDIPVDTFNKIWITPESATVLEKGNSALILETKLKVMTERDYLSMENNAVIRESGPAPVMTETTELSARIVKEIILPAIEKEVNEGRNFANLRQIYHSMVLATWYKKSLKQSLLGKIYADKAKTKGIDQDPKNNDAVYQKYVTAFKKGAFNFIKEDYDKYSQETIPRKYFSGGWLPAQPGLINFAQSATPQQLAPVNAAMNNADFEDATIALNQQVKPNSAMRVKNSHILYFGEDTFEYKGPMRITAAGKSFYIISYEDLMRQTDFPVSDFGNLNPLMRFFLIDPQGTVGNLIGARALRDNDLPVRPEPDRFQLPPAFAQDLFFSVTRHSEAGKAMRWDAKAAQLDLFTIKATRETKIEEMDITGPQAGKESKRTPDFTFKPDTLENG